MKCMISAEKKRKLKQTAQLMENGGMADIEVAHLFKYEPIDKIAAKLGIKKDEIEHYGDNKAKIKPRDDGKQSKLVLVTAVNPTPAGEGKTTASIGLVDALALKGVKVCAALREPSLGPVFGLKGGATGGGLSQIIPMEDINLHFTGDLHAITAANNLLSALIDNHIYQGNELRLDKDRIMWRRATDTNDRALRRIGVALGGTDGQPREDGFNITAASEIMAMLCLAADLQDLKHRLGEISIGYDLDGRLVHAKELGGTDAMAILMKDAIKPNLVQTLAGTPVIVHGGPFANIAHGCNSLIATKTALSYADVVVTEAGFGADLGAEKFLNVKCRIGGISPDAVVIVATARALKMHGGAKKSELKNEDLTALKNGLPNLEKHIENVTKHFNLPAVVAINKFTGDTKAEIDLIKKVCAYHGVKAIETEVWAKGGYGAKKLADEVMKILEGPKQQLSFTYDDSDEIEVKIEKICKNVYGGKGVYFTKQAQKQINDIKNLGFGKLPVIIAKTQYSLSDDPLKTGRPEEFYLTVREVQLRSGSGFIVAVAGNIMLMPGLPKVPAACNMTITQEGVIHGLF